uniref:Uncharacterized protein n=1 Tax=Pararge aegeria TaxID=116150 RepID=S4NYY6_9NEOP
MIGNNTGNKRFVETLNSDVLLMLNEYKIRIFLRIKVPKLRSVKRRNYLEIKAFQLINKHLIYISYNLLLG